MSVAKWRYIGGAVLLSIGVSIVVLLLAGLLIFAGQLLFVRNATLDQARHVWQLFGVTFLVGLLLGAPAASVGDSLAQQAFVKASGLKQVSTEEVTKLAFGRKISLTQFQAELQLRIAKKDEQARSVVAVIKEEIHEVYKDRTYSARLALLVRFGLASSFILSCLQIPRLVNAELPLPGVSEYLLFFAPCVSVSPLFSYVGARVAWSQLTDELEHFEKSWPQIRMRGEMTILSLFGYESRKDFVERFPYPEEETNASPLACASSTTEHDSDILQD